MLTIKNIFSNTFKFLCLTMRGKKNAKTVAAAAEDAEYSVDEIATLLNANKGHGVMDIPQGADLPTKKSKGRGKKNVDEVETAEIANKANSRNKQAAAEIEVPQENGTAALGRGARKRTVISYGNEFEVTAKKVRVNKLPSVAEESAKSNGHVQEIEAEVVPKANNRRGKKIVNKAETEVEVEVPVEIAKGRGKKIKEPETVNKIENTEPEAAATRRKGKTAAKKSVETKVEEIIENSSEEKKVTKKATTTTKRNKKNDIKEEHEEEKEEEADEAEEEEKATTKSKKTKKAAAAKPKRGKNSAHITADEESVAAPASELVENKSRKRTATAKVKANDEEEEAAATSKKVLKNETETNYEEGNFNIKKDFNLKISSWNVAGMRSWIKKGGLQFIDHEKPDILCLQETKCEEAQLPKEAVEVPGYHPYWLCMPGGYAGVAIYSRIMPIHIEYGIGNEKFDKVGRLITAEYEKFYLINVYVPNSGRKLVNLAERMDWEQLFLAHVKRFDQLKPVIICGDMNVSHQEIDLANPKSNTRNAGFTAEEREKMTQLLAAGFVDTFRHLYPKKKDAYTFWTYMGGARARNVGWRLDYFLTSERILANVVDQTFRTQVLGSDHCPITLFMKF